MQDDVEKELGMKKTRKITTCKASTFYTDKRPSLDRWEIRIHPDKDNNQPFYLVHRAVASGMKLKRLVILVGKIEVKIPPSKPIDYREKG